MLTQDEVREWTRRFGVADAQIRRHHLLSHALAGIAELVGDDVVFIGGTALSRTHLTEPPWARMSEDIDLLVVTDASAVRVALEERLPRLPRREYPDAAWVVAPTRSPSPAPALLSSQSAQVQVQFLTARGGWAAWRRVPTERRAVQLRYGRHGGQRRACRSDAAGLRCDEAVGVGGPLRSTRPVRSRRVGRTWGVHPCHGLDLPRPDWTPAGHGHLRAHSRRNAGQLAAAARPSALGRRRSRRVHRRRSECSGRDLAPVDPPPRRAVQRRRGAAQGAAPPRASGPHGA